MCKFNGPPLGIVILLFVVACSPLSGISRDKPSGAVQSSPHGRQAGHNSIRPLDTCFQAQPVVSSVGPRVWAAGQVYAIVVSGNFPGDGQAGTGCVYSSDGVYTALD